MRGALSPVGFVNGEKASSGDDASESFEKKFGESVASLVDRLEPIALEVEAAPKPVFIVAYEAPCRTLRALVSFSTSFSDRPSVRRSDSLSSAHYSLLSVLRARRSLISSRSAHQRDQGYLRARDCRPLLLHHFTQARGAASD